MSNILCPRDGSELVWTTDGLVCKVCKLILNEYLFNSTDTVHCASEREVEELSKVLSELEPPLPHIILTNHNLPKLMKEDYSPDNGLGEKRLSQSRPTSSTLPSSRVPGCPPETHSKIDKKLKKRGVL